MVYFDNAATSRPKPEPVLSAFVNYVQELGVSPGRGSYSPGIQASRMLYQSRKTVTTFFGCPSKTNVVFTKNSTEAINLFFNGFLQDGDHVLISPFEHNAVLRPLHTLKLQGRVQYDIIPENVLRKPEELKKMFRHNTRLAAITLASNLTGEIIFNREIARICKDNAIAVFVDASQGGGKMLLNMSRDNIDYLAFTGHKDLLGLPGVGGLVSCEELTFKPLIQGGTGIHGDEYTNPSVYPDGYEAGTINMPAIWALKTAIDYVSSHHIELKEAEDALMQHLLSGLRSLPNIILIRPEAERVPTVCFNVKGKSSSEVVAFLDQHGICVRGGIHCAILAHQALDTVKTGAVRVSINSNNTHEEIDYFLNVLREA